MFGFSMGEWWGESGRVAGRGSAVWRGGRAVWTAAVSMLLLLAGAAGHDIPTDVTLQAFLKPEGRGLNLLVRTPLPAIRDVTFPERGAGFLDIERAQPLLADAALQWIGDFVELYENDAPLTKKPRVVGARISLGSDRSFDSYEQATAHITGPKLAGDVNVPWAQTMLDVWLEYPIESDRSAFSIRPEWGRLGQRVVTALRFIPAGGTERAFELNGDPGLVRLDPRWHQAARRFVEMGFYHILDGTDHLLFLFCLVIPFRHIRGLIAVVTSFTVAHSVTLIASAYDLGPGALWFPPLIEMLIAASIVYMALENITGASVRRRWVVAFGFGLVHGFGFSFALRETLQFAGRHLLTSLLSFNIGVELGQLLVLLALVPALDLLFRYVVAERIGTIILSAIVAHTGWHWMTERWERLRMFHVEVTLGMAAGALRWIALLALGAAVVWFTFQAMRRLAFRKSE
jgi:hypothetical protein